MWKQITDILIDSIDVDSDQGIAAKCSIWNLPDDLQMSMIGDDSVHFPLKCSYSLPVECTINAIWEPSNNNNILSISENTIYYFDCNTSEPQV
jgi:hypothetical protein